MQWCKGGCTDPEAPWWGGRKPSSDTDLSDSLSRWVTGMLEAVLKHPYFPLSQGLVHTSTHISRQEYVWEQQLGDPPLCSHWEAKAQTYLSQVPFLSRPRALVHSAGEKSSCSVLGNRYRCFAPNLDWGWSQEPGCYTSCYTGCWSAAGSAFLPHQKLPPLQMHAVYTGDHSHTARLQPAQPLCCLLSCQHCRSGTGSRYIIFLPGVSFGWCRSHAGCCNHWKGLQTEVQALLCQVRSRHLMPKPLLHPHPP